MSGDIKNFQLMAKPSGSVCNISCSYCFYLEKSNLYPERKNHWKMDGNTLRNYIIKYIDGQRADIIDFIWQGGEPTLVGIDFYREAVRLQNKYSRGKKINNFFQTNGVNIDDEWAIFLKKNRFLVGISIDGDRISNDKHRVTRTGKSTYDAVIKGLEALKRHHVEFNTLTVINSENVKRPKDVYNVLKRLGCRYMQFIPLVERRAVVADENGLTLIQPDFTGQCSVTEWSVSAKAYGHFLNTLFDHWITHDLGNIFVMNFEEVMAKLVGQNSNCVINETCGGNLVIEANGDVYSCDHFVYPEYRLGNINNDDLNEMVNSPRNVEFSQNKQINISRECKKCAFLAVCNGGCQKHRFNISDDGRPNKNYFCEGILIHLNHSLPMMHYLLGLMRKNSSLNKTRKAIRIALRSAKKSH